MELEQLRIFVAVARCGSFSLGAKKLYISHSTTSRAVAALEAELGVRLLERGNRVLGLTAAGECLLEEAERGAGPRGSGRTGKRKRRIGGGRFQAL